MITVRERVVRIFRETLGVSDSQVKDSSSLTDDLGCDSLDIVDLVMNIEDEFKITIPQNTIDRLDTVSDILNFVNNIN